MNPLLLGVAGPNRGKAFKLTDEESSIGRDPSSWLCLRDESASRHHCIIRRESDTFTITDLESRNGTFVNDIPTHERILQHGDRIVIGNCIFLFLDKESESTATNEDVTSNVDAWIVRSTVEMRPENSFYVQDEKIGAARVDDTAGSRHLNVLLKISNVIYSVREESALLQRLLELVFEAVPAERVAIFISEDENGLVKKCSQPPEFIEASHTVVGRVFKDGMALLSNDVQQNESLLKAQSLVTSQVASLMAVPIMAFEKTLGVLYLESGNSKVRFGNDQLELMTAIGRMLAVALINVRQMKSLENENRQLLENVKIQHNMIGESSCMENVYRFISKVAATNSTILIRGESGTGKELVAQAIHLNSPRSNKPFVVVNCPALSESLLESELFGHEKGAFTGAIAQKKGKLEIADGGTVFLDEIAELPLQLQSKFLRVLQEHEFDRVGGTRPIKIDVRFIAATNKNLEQEIASGSFRSDLFHRLNVLAVTLPPLRERRGDVPLLATYFANKYSKKCKRPLIGISAAARSCLKSYEWVGNVRELENAIERAVVLATNDAIMPEDLPEAILEACSLDEAKITKYHLNLRETKKQLVLKAFQEAQGNHNEAARILGINPKNLYRLIRNLNLKSLPK